MSKNIVIKKKHKYFLRRLLRPELLLASVLWEEPDAIQQAKNLLHSAMTNNTLIPANLREVSDSTDTFNDFQLSTK